MLVSQTIFNTAIANKQDLHEGQISSTHGFVPYTAMPKKMPDGYEVLDELATLLPELIKKYQERTAVEKKLKEIQLDMSDPAKLPDYYLARASMILDSLAHAYYFNKRECPIHDRSKNDPLPDYLLKPWKQVTDRIGRADAIRTNYDNFMCNWYKTNPDVAVPNSLDDVQLLVPAFNNNEERVFDLTIMMMELKFAPAVAAIVEALAACEKHDDNKLIEALKIIKDSIEQVTEAFSKIDVNEGSKNYVDPVIWTKTVARFDGSIRLDNSGNELPGVSGSSSPLFHLLDAFIQRIAYESELGKQIKAKQRWMPRQHVDFINAVAKDAIELDLKNYIESSNNLLLKNTYQSLLNAYDGENGLLSKHRLKVFGFMELNFKAGRKKTNGGHEGGASRQEAPHINLNKSFVAAKDERLKDHDFVCPYARKLYQKTLSEQANEIILDISKSGLSFKPGERCSVLPQNSPELIRKTLKALKASGEEVITLNSDWKKYLSFNYRNNNTEIKLCDFLKYAHISPINHELGLALYQITTSTKLLSMLHTSKPGGYELWELLEELGTDNKSLLSFQAEQNNFIGHLLKPLSPRLYSVSPVYDATGIESGKIRLTVGTHQFLREDYTRKGIASNYLASLANNEQVIIQKITAFNFQLPEDDNKPILMFAMGTGIAPFIGFIEARANLHTKGKNWLFLSTKPNNILYKEKLEKLISDEHLQLETITSRTILSTAIKENAAEIANLIISEQAHIYVCGQSDYANAVLTSLLEALQPYHVDKDFIHMMQVNKRYQTDIFSPTSSKPLVYKNLSEVLAHTDAQNFWSVINGKVYDLESFAGQHPGGKKILRVNAGLDASKDYNALGHHLDHKLRVN